VKVGELLMNRDATVMVWIKERLLLKQQNISHWFCNNHIIKELVKELAKVKEEQFKKKKSFKKDSARLDCSKYYLFDKK
jgi:hypothetical protein